MSFFHRLRVHSRAQKKFKPLTTATITCTVCAKAQNSIEVFYDQHNFKIGALLSCQQVALGNDREGLAEVQHLQYAFTR